MNIVDKVMYVSEDRVVIYLADRQFEVVTNKGEAVKLAVELLYPYFEMKKLKSEEHTIITKAA